MKMRCPKCGSSFTVMQDGTVNGSEPPPSAAPKAAPSVGAPAPPPKKKPLFAPRPAPEIPLADPFGGELDLGLPETPNLGGLDDGGDFGSIDLGLDAGLPDPGATDLPAPAGFKDLPAPAAAARPPRAPAPSAPADFDDLPAPADFDDLPAPANFDDLPAPSPGFADDLPAARPVAKPSATPASLSDSASTLDSPFSADLDGGPPPPPAPPPPPPAPAKAGAPNEVGTKDAGTESVPQIKVKKKRSGLKIALVVVPTLALAGGSLTFTQAGPYGYYAITDAMNRKPFEGQLAALRTSARENLAKDTSVESEALVNQARMQQEGQPRFAPIAHYTASLAFLNSLRFGKNSELDALAKSLLDGVGAREEGPLRQAALAGRFALEGRFEDALPQALEAAEKSPEDIDILAISGEIALAAKKADVAVKQWKAALALEKSARTHYGLARAELQAQNEKDAIVNAEHALRLSAAHAGARTLIAQTLWMKDSTEAQAKKLLDEVIAKGPVRSGASTTEVVRAFNLLGYIQLRHSQLTAAEKTFGEAMKIDPQSEEALIGNGELLYEAGRFTDSMARFEAAKSVNPNSVLAAIGIAKVKLGQELFKEALTDLQRLSERGPDPLVGYWLGRTHVAMGKRDEAEKVYRAAIAKGGETQGVVRAYVALADLLASRAKADEAAKVLEEAATKLPNSFELHLAKGDVALNAARLDEAKAEFQTALQLDDQNVAPMFKLGIVHRKAREYDDAKKRFEAVASADPNYPGLAIEWGLWYSENGQTEQALNMYKDALQKAPEDIDLMFRVGSTQVLNNQSAEAIKHLETVFGKRRTSPEVNYFLGRAHLQEGNAQKALGYLRTAARADVNRADYQLYFGWAAADANQQTEAEKAIDAALALDATLADGYWQRGVLLQRKGKVTEALLDLKTAVDKSPLRFEAYAALAVCYGELTQHAEAEEAWRMAVAGRDIPEWHYRLAKLLMNKNAKDEAIEHLEKAVDGAAKVLEEKKSAQPPAWLADANYQLGEALRIKKKERALKAYVAYLKLAAPDDAYRKDAESAVKLLGGRLN